MRRQRANFLIYDYVNCIAKLVPSFECHLQAEHDFFVVLREERSRDTILPRTSSTTDTVTVRLDLRREFVIDNLLRFPSVRGSGTVVGERLKLGGGGE